MATKTCKVTNESNRAIVVPDDAPAGAPIIDGHHHPGFKWLDNIACQDLEPEKMFAKAGHVLPEESKAKCMTCPVWRECTIFSYMGAPEGRMITGGYFAALSPGQRKKLSLSEALELGEKMRAEYLADIQA